jgi:hypothetical protein
LAAGARVGFTGVGVPNAGREKLQKLGRGVFAGIRENRWNDVGVANA